MSEAAEHDYNVLVFFVPGNENFDFLKNNFPLICLLTSSSFDNFENKFSNVLVLG